MKELADFIRFLSPNLTDKTRFTFLSKLHFLTSIAMIFIFVHFKSIYIKLFVLVYGLLTLYLQTSYRECPASLLEREFSSETWDDILDSFFKYLKWDITRSEKIVGFTCFFIGALIIMCAVILNNLLFNF
jgi:hypothetical protein